MSIAGRLLVSTEINLCTSLESDGLLSSKFVRIGIYIAVLSRDVTIELQLYL